MNHLGNVISLTKESEVAIMDPRVTEMVFFS